jgi:hypothetical protein
MVRSAGVLFVALWACRFGGWATLHTSPPALENVVKKAVSEGPAQHQNPTFNPLRPAILKEKDRCESANLAKFEGVGSVRSWKFPGECPGVKYI